MRIRLHNKMGYLDFNIPEDRQDAVSQAGTLHYMARAYTFRGLAGGKLLYDEAGPAVVLNDGWLDREVIR